MSPQVSLHTTSSGLGPEYANTDTSVRSRSEPSFERIASTSGGKKMWGSRARS